MGREKFQPHSQVNLSRHWGEAEDIMKKISISAVGKIHHRLDHVLCSTSVRQKRDFRTTKSLRGVTKFQICECWTSPEYLITEICLFAEIKQKKKFEGRCVDRERQQQFSGDER